MRKKSKFKSDIDVVDTDWAYVFFADEGCPENREIFGVETEEMGHMSKRWIKEAI